MKSRGPFVDDTPPGVSVVADCRIVASAHALATFVAGALSAPVVDEVAGAACRLIEELLGCDDALIWNPPADRTATDGMDGADAVRPQGEGLVSFVCNCAEPVVYENALREKRFDATPLVRRGYRCGVMVRIGDADRPLGIVGAHSRSQREFSPAEIAVISIVANVIALAAARLDADAKARTARAAIVGESGDAALLSEAESMAHIGSWQADRRGHVLCSDELYRIMGIEPQSRELTLELAARLAPNGFGPLRNAARRGMPAETEHELIRLDGTVRYVRSWGRPAAGGKYVGAVQDITEAVVAAREEERLRNRVTNAALAWKLTFDSIPSPILLVNHDLRVIRLNAGALRLSKFDRYQNALGAKVDELGGTALWTELASVAAEVGDHSVITVRKHDSEGRWWDVTASAWSAAGTRRVTLFANDVTGLVGMQETLQRNERMSTVGSLIAGVAHEVRNPLFAISATLDALDATSSAEVPARFTAALRAQVNRMNELMQDLLEYGRPQQVELSAGDLAVLLGAARSSITAFAEKSGVRIELSVQPALPPVRMERGRLLQVFENLLRNAVQHSTSGTTVEIRAVADEAEVEVTVSDRGSGLRTEDLPRIFEPFFTRRRGGTGLGLPLAQRIVHDHGGEITAAQRDGGGAVMRVRLPAVRTG